jgi:conjugal transfer/entry exclusion protein
MELVMTNSQTKEEQAYIDLSTIRDLTTNIIKTAVKATDDIELQIQELDDELLMYMIQRAEYELNRRYEKRLKGRYGKS